MPKPGDWRGHHAVKPKSDNEYFEYMSRIIFLSGLNWRILEPKWPGIRNAFDDFDAETVADYDDAKVDQLMEDRAVIRNLAKIRAVIGNAAEALEVAKEYGSFAQFLDKLEDSGGEDGMMAGVSKRFAFMGKGTTVLFLFSVGREMPKAAKKWQEAHKP